MMKIMKTAKLLLVLVFSLLLALAATSCDGNGGSTEPTYGDFSVTVLDCDNEAVSGIIVSVYKGNECVDTNVTDKDGRSEFTGLENTEYTVMLQNTSVKNVIYYDTATAKLSPEANNLSITVYASITEATNSIYGNIPDGTKAYSLELGEYHVKTNEGMTYLMLELTRQGIYEISLKGDENLTIGNFGNPYYVMESDISKDNDTGRSFTMKCEGDRVQLVVGIQSQAAADAIVTVKYVSELEDDPLYAPWIPVYPENELSQYTLSDNMKLSDLDITDENLTVVLGNDGYYHLGTADGPIVLVRVTESTEYIDSFSKISETTNFGWYKYDGDTFVGKERFNELIDAYADICDTGFGVCPLTEELAYAIRSFGEYSHWWDFSCDYHIFGTDSLNIVKENAWLFACATAELDTEKGTSPESENALSLREAGEFTMYENATLYYTCAEIADVTVNITDADGVLKVSCDGVEYTASNGVISFTLTGATKSFSVTCTSGTETVIYSYTSTVAAE